MSILRQASVAAVIPTRNRPEMVLAAVRSALAQSVPVVEVIVVIDGPDAATSSALRRFQQAEADTRLRVIELEEPVGGAEARNIGVRHARAAWIAFLDDDDLWLPEKIGVQLANAEASTAREPVVSCAVLARGPRVQQIWPRRPYRYGESMAEYLFCRKGWTYGGAFLQTSTLFASRELLLRLPFEPGLKKHQDWDWLLRVSVDPVAAVSTVAEPLVVFHIESARSSVSRTPDWRFSLHWARERRDLLSAKAFAAFIATECMPQAARAGATHRERAQLFLTMLREGSPTLRACLFCVAFSLVPHGLRRSMRDLWNLFSLPLSSSTAQLPRGS